MNKVKNRDLYSIVKIARKNDLPPENLVDAFNEALYKGESWCGDLRVSCRFVDHYFASIMVTKEKSVIFQASISLEMLTNRESRIDITRIILPEKKTGLIIRKLKIGELRCGMKGVEVVAEVTEIPATKLVNTKWGSQALVSNVKLVDETGSIKLSLWNGQIEAVKIGDEIQVTNGNIAKFMDELQLRVARKGLVLNHNHLSEKIISPN